MFRITQCFSVLSFPSLSFFCVSFSVSDSPQTLSFPPSLSLPPSQPGLHPYLTFLHFGPCCGLWTLTRKLLPSAGHSPTQEVELFSFFTWPALLC